MESELKKKTQNPKAKPNQQAERGKIPKQNTKKTKQTQMLYCFGTSYVTPA